MRNLNLKKTRLSSVTETMFKIGTNMSLMGNSIEEVDKTTIDLWALYNNEGTLIGNSSGPSNMLAVVLPNVKEWYRRAVWNSASWYAELVLSELPIFDNDHCGFNQERVEASILHHEHEAYDMYEKSMANPGYLHATNNLAHEIEELLCIRGLIMNLSVSELFRYQKTLATFVKLYLMKSNLWDDEQYNSLLPEAQVKADDFRSGDLIANVLLSLQHPQIRRVLNMGTRHRDQLTAEIVVNALLLRAIFRD